MESSWQSALVAFGSDRFETAAKQVSHAISYAKSTLDRSVLQINGHAVKVEQRKTTPPPPPHVFRVRLPTPSIFLHTEEATLTAAYNVALLTLRTDAKNEAVILQIRNKLNRVHAVLRWLQTPDENAQDVLRAHLGEGSCTAAVDSLLLNYDHIVENESLCTHARRWADAAASAFELMAASYLYRAFHTEALKVATDARSLRQLEKALLPNVKLSLRTGDVEMEAADNITPEGEAERIVENAERHDKEGTRANFLIALSYASNKNAGYALPDTLAYSEQHMIDETTHLPSAYLTAVVFLLEGKKIDRAVSLLELCASRAYRTADSLALIARTKRGSDSIEPWKALFAMDHARPACLWMAAREFGREKRWNGQAELLACLEDILKGDEIVKKPFISIGDAFDVTDVVTVESTNIELAKALIGNEKWSVARELLIDIHDKIGERSDVLRDRAWTEIYLGNIEQGLRFADDAYIASSTETDAAGALLAKAEGLFRNEKVEEAREALLSAFREAKLASASNSEAHTLLRGICYHNMGAFHSYRREFVSGDECFAAAQTAFGKCDGAFKKFGESFALWTTFSRCICMWEGGRVVDAAGHWVMKRGLDIEENSSNSDMIDSDDNDSGPNNELVCSVDDTTLRRFDLICIDELRGAEARKKAEAAMIVNDKVALNGDGGIDLRSDLT